ncbi:acyltransferase family protein [Leucobacter soli]|uniref:acyltransferase family protein n=1 Tax=Leucobacter soli TaxID=2812850 RepID=UPI001C407E51|nr:acyltransferase family protein [Leucobacter soli]
MPQASTTAAAPRAASQAKLPFTGFRPDIQGLRAVAVGVVLLFHANFPFMPGGFVGVDVFFVISGYLITGLLLREAITTGRIDLPDFYARRARRILPAATVVLVATLALTAIFLPQIRWQQIGIEAAGAAVYVVNWILAGGTDYLNADTAASPLQHFWTLSVEEQFYIVWPLILIVMLWIAGRTLKKTHAAFAEPGRTLRFAGVGVLLILVPSLIWSVYYTTAHPAPAYFVTTTRLWELAIGAALAVFAVQIARIPDWLGYLLGWAGLVGILVASLFYTSSAPAFPGSAGLLPTLSAAAVIAGGMNGRATRGAGRLLGLRPMRWIGDISYSLYLWHWPLIVVGTYLLGGELRFRWGLVIVVFAILPAWLSYRFIENPFRDWKALKASAKRSLGAGAGLVAVTLALATVIAYVPRMTAPEVPEAETGTPIGAEVLFEAAQSGSRTVDLDAQSYSYRTAGDLHVGEEMPLILDQDLIASFEGIGAPTDEVEGGFTPAAIDARKDNPVLYEMGCQLDEDTAEPKPCVFGDEQSDTTIMLVGDSHAASWMPALDAIAEKNGWRLVTNTKSGCSFADVSQTRFGGAFPACDEWNEGVLEQILDEQPALVVTINAGRRGVWAGDHSLKGDEKVRAFGQGLRSHWSTLNDAGIPVRVLMDTAEMHTDVPECVSANPTQLTECATPREDALDTRPHPEIAAVQDLPATELINMNDWICPDAEYCPAIVGNVLVWRDTDHLTATFSRTLALPLEDALLATQKADGSW